MKTIDKADILFELLQLRLVVDGYGEKRYYNHANKLHREFGPAIIYRNGKKEWYLNGERHREDGPAVEYADGYKAWYINGERHREDGPAVIYSGGEKYWYINGKHLTEYEFLAHPLCTMK